jgi:hypothetical protein
LTCAGVIFLERILSQAELQPPDLVER